MSFITRWFKKNEREDYEEILAALALDIRKRATRLSEIRLRERRATLLVTMYTLASWTVYLTMWYTNILPNFSGRNRHSAFEKFAKALPVIVGPVVILFTRRIAQIWYKRKGDAEEKTLATLHKQQREQIENIKKKTNYYTTRNLLERYDDSPTAPQASPLSRRVQSIPSTPIQPQRPLQVPQQTPQTPNRPRFQLVAPQQPLPPPRKQWYDKLADAILGDDDSSAPPSSRYALICRKCFAHNGLVKESLWQDTQYVCPKCGHFNSRPLERGSPPQPSTTNDLAASTKSRKTASSLSSSHPTVESTTSHPVPIGSEKPVDSSDKLHKRQPFEMDEGNSTVDMEIDS